jgi:hypothetical protein
MHRSGKLFLISHMLEVYWQQASTIRTTDMRWVDEKLSWIRARVGRYLLRCKNQLRQQPSFICARFFDVGPSMTQKERIGGIDRSVGRNDGMIDEVEARLRIRIRVDTGGAARPSTMALILVLVVALLTDIA